MPSKVYRLQRERAAPAEASDALQVDFGAEPLKGSFQSTSSFTVGTEDTTTKTQTSTDTNTAEVIFTVYEAATASCPACKCTLLDCEDSCSLREGHPSWSLLSCACLPYPAEGLSRLVQCC